MSRLTNEIRDKIIDNAIKKALGDRESVQLKELADNFSAKLIETAVGDNLGKLKMIEQSIADLISQIPENFRQNETETHVRKDSAVRLNIAGQAVDWFFDDAQIFPLTNWRERYVIPQGHIRGSLMEDYRAEQ